MQSPIMPRLSFPLLWIRVQEVCLRERERESGNIISKETQAMPLARVVLPAVWAPLLINQKNPDISAPLSNTCLRLGICLTIQEKKQNMKNHTDI